MIGRLYTVAIGAETQSTAKTLIEIASAADSVTLLERAYISQSSFDTSENTAAKIQRVTTTGTGTAHTMTSREFQLGDANFGGTVKTNLSVPPTYTADTELVEQGFNVLSGWLWTPANDDEVIVLSPSGLVGIAFDVTVSSMNMHYGATIREIGG
jgi:hypothetical protein